MSRKLVLKKLIENATDTNEALNALGILCEMEGIKGAKKLINELRDEAKKKPERKPLGETIKLYLTVDKIPLFEDDYAGWYITHDTSLVIPGQHSWIIEVQIPKLKAIQQ